MLENKIEELTKAIIVLTEFLQGKDLKEEIKALEEIDTKAELTHDDLKEACLTSARADLANKNKIKALLKEYGATKAVDVCVSKLEEVINRIQKGEF